MRPDRINKQFYCIYHSGRLSTLIKAWSASSATFYRRDSCEFTTCVSPCVRKATTHLQDLKDQLSRLSVVQEGDTWQANAVEYISSREGI
jgi:hypothetical protein